MNRYNRIRRFLAAFLSAIIVLGIIPVVEKAHAVTTAIKVVQIAAAQNNSIALKSDGTIIAWGNNIDSWAKPPAGLTGVVEIYAKDSNFLARKSNGTIVVWGSNEVGEATIPPGLDNVISMAAAGNHTLAVRKTSSIANTGEVFAWGLNANGQSNVPSYAKSAVVKVAAGTHYSMALKFDGTVIDWGSNGSGATSMPAGLSNVTAIDAGSNYALALKSDGTVVAWGREHNENGILDVSGLSNIKAISANRTYALALKNDGTVVGWGYSAHGAANPPAGLTDVAAISAGVNHALALKSDGTVVSWGLQTTLPGDNELNSLTLAEGAANTAFDPDVTSYHYNIDPGATRVNINAVLKDAAFSALYINDQQQTSGSTVSVAVPAAGATIKVQVVPYMKPQNARTYTLTISRDRVAPAVTISPNGSPTAVRTITTAVEILDAVSAVDGSTLQYAWTQSDTVPSTGWTNFSLIPTATTNDSAQLTHTGEDGSWYLHIRAKDHAGNEATVTSASFLIDNTAPRLDVTMKKADDGEDYPNNTWTDQSVVITATATDAQSASVTLTYTLDGGKTWLDYTGPITISDSGIYTVILQTSDALGNVRTESRTIKITKGDLKLTITMEKTTVGGDYSSGEWTNSAVRVTAMAETKVGETLTSFTYSQKIGDIEVATDEPNNPSGVFFATTGMHSGDFKVTDSMGISLTAPYAINIDRISPAVTFTPNGNESSTRVATVGVTVEDNGGSGLVESSLQYVWSQSTTPPADGWLPFNNDSTLTMEGVDGKWYLHVKGQDTAGNEVCREDKFQCINDFSNKMNVVSNAFELDNSALGSTISPNTASFDLKASAQADVVTEMTLRGNTLEGISNEADPLIVGTDYEITGNTVIIRRSYLAAQSVGTTNLTFTFSGGAEQTLEITIDNTTPSNSEISPDIAAFDKRISAQVDVVTTLALNGNTLDEISNGGIVLVRDTHYTVSGDTVTITRSYLAELPLGLTSLTFTFSAGAAQTLILMINDTTPSNSTISPDEGSFDKKASEQADIETTLMLNGNTLEGISNGGDVLGPGTDYRVDDDPVDGYTVTILKSYLATQPEGPTNLIFTFSAGADQTLIITVTDTRLKEATPAITIDYANEELAGFEAAGSYTIDGISVSPVGGKLDAEDYLGESLAIVKKGDGTTTVDSGAQELAVPSRPATPTATAVNPTTIGGTGKITGVTTTMEYKVSTAVSWTDVTGSEIGDLSAGSYQVRVKATATSFKSAEQMVILIDPAPTAETTPAISIAYAEEELTGFQSGGSYTIDGAAVAPVGGKLDVTGYMGTTIAIVKKGNGTTTTDSAAQNLTVPSRPSTPTATGIDPPIVGGTGSIAGVTAAMEYKTSTGNWTDVAGTEIAGLAVGSYQLRVKATSSSFKSAEQSITLTDPVPTAEAKPVISIVYAEEELTGFQPGGSYTMDGAAVTPVGGKLDVTGYMGTTIAIVKKGNGTTTTDSTAQNLTVPTRPSTPTATGVDPATIGGTGSITGVTAAMEYKTSTGNWTDVAGTEIAGLAAGSYQLRVKATASSFKSAEQNITLSDPAPTAEMTPAIAIDYAEEELTGFQPGGSYTIDGAAVTPIGGKLDVMEYLGATIAIVKKGNGTTTADSTAQNLTVPTRPSTPTATGVDPATIGGTGSITGVTAAMEYKSSTGNWADVMGTEITGLAAGSYQLRVKATASSFKSGEQSIALTDPAPTAEATPVITIDYTEEELTGFQPGGSYTMDGAAVTPVGGKLDVTGYMGTTIAIVKKGNETTTTDSAAQNLVVPSRPSTPTATGLDPTIVGGTGSITGVTAAMEYKSSIGNWTDVTGTEIAGLAAGSYQLRVKATATSFKSAEQSITLTDPAPTAETTPAIAIDYAEEELTGFQPGDSYTVDGTAVTPVGGKLDVAGYMGTTIAIVKKGNGTTTTDSAVQNLVVPSRPSTPTATGVEPTIVGGTGIITGVTAAMEYKTSTGNWTDVAGTEIAGLAAGSYQLRVKATASSFKSAEQILTLTAPPPQNSTIGPDTGSFDKKTFAQADVTTTMTLNGNALVSINNGAAALLPGTDYVITGSAVTIHKSYLEAQPVGTTNLTFTFSAGADQTLAITVSDTTLPGYTVTYSGNGATSGSPPADNGSYGQGVAVSVYGNLGVLSKTGYTFAGWNTQADGNGTNYAAEAIFTMGTANVTLYAKWKSNNADLSGLTLPGNTLNPPFAAITTSYTVNVTNSIGSIMVMATASDAVHATVTATMYNHQGTITIGPIPLTSGAVSPSLPLNVGINSVHLVVTAEDGTTKTYQIHVSRASTVGGGSGGPVAPLEPIEEQEPEPPTEEPSIEVPSPDTNPTITFSDIAGHWAEAYIKQAAGSGIVSGYPDGTFKPGRAVTRAEFTVMLMNALMPSGEGTALTFTDAAKIGSWAQKAVAQAVQAGIIHGYEDGSFRPDAEITRTEMAMMLANAMRVSLEASAATGFADDRSIPVWAKGAVAAMKKLGLIEGKGSNEFDPGASTTRAEAVTVLMRMFVQKS